MGYSIENDCVGCETCVGCGRRYDYIVRYCDDCGYNESVLYKTDDGQELCWDCYLNQYESRVCEADDATVCANCGRDEDILYLVNGEWVCEDCIYAMAETVDMEGE